MWARDGRLGRPRTCIVSHPRPCATTTFNRRKAAVNQTPPPYPCFHVWSASANPLSYAVAAFRLAQEPDAKKTSRIAEQLIAVSDDVLAQALMSLVYALAIGEPDGTTLLGGDPSRRHDFGLDTAAADLRIRAAWAEPRDVKGEGGRHIFGALVGLDIGLSSMALRRINAVSLPPIPTLTLPDRDTFVKTLAMMNPLDRPTSARL